MSLHEQEAEQQHLLLMVESAQRAGLSETEIEKILDAARQDDAALEQAA
jgi:Xaa-Pro aminopeptidase